MSEKKLVAFFSASGVTARKAKQLAEAAGADLYEISPEQKYTEADLDWRNKKSRSTLEMTDASSRPKMAGAMPELGAYGIVYLGFPVWWYTAPRIVNTFLESGDFTGKKIMLFATSGSSGVEGAVKDLKKKYPQLNIVGGKLLNGAFSGDIL
jgi:flavodoxin